MINSPTQTLAFIGNFGGGEIILIFLIVLLLFGAKKVPELFRSLGKGVNEFRKAKNDWEQDINEVMSQEPIEDHDVGAEDQGLSQVDIGDDSTIVHEALAELKPEQRQVIMMSVVDGLTHFDIATSTGLPVGTVKSHIRRGLSKAADHLRSKQGGSSEV